MLLFCICGISPSLTSPDGAIRAAWTANRTPWRALDYPRTFEEMALWFRDDAACQSYIRRLRWPGGFICPHCGVGVHLPLQPPPLTGTGPAVPPPCRANRGGCPGALPRHHRKASKSSRFRGVGSVKGISHSDNSGGDSSGHDAGQLAGGTGVRVSFGTLACAGAIQRFPVA